MSQDDQIYMMQLIQHGDDFTVIDDETESYILDDDVNINQENFDLKQNVKLLQEANDGLKWELNKVSASNTVIQITLYYKQANEQILSLSAERDSETTEKLLFEIKCRLKEAQAWIDINCHRKHIGIYTVNR